MTPRFPTRATSLLLAAMFLVSYERLALADDPKPKPGNTIHVELSPLVTPQPFARAVRFFVAEVVDRSGNPQPMLLMKSRGGLFVDHQPIDIVKDGIMASLKAANLLASDESQADIILKPYLFHFGLENGSGMDYFGKVEFAVTVKDAKTGESKDITAVGTSIAGIALRKKNIGKNLQGDLNAALQDAVTNLLRGTQLRDAVNSLAENEAAVAAVVETPVAGTPAENVPTLVPAETAPIAASTTTEPSPTTAAPAVATAPTPAVREASAAEAVSKEFVWSIKTTEAKHFTRAEGVELSPAFTDYLYAEIRNELTKSKKYGQVIGEGETVNAPDAGNSVVIDGVLTEYKKGNRVTDGLIGFGVGARSLRMNVTMARRSDQQSVSHIEIHVRVTPRMTEQVMARFAAKGIADGLRKYWERQRQGS